MYRLLMSLILFLLFLLPACPVESAPLDNTSLDPAVGDRPDVDQSRRHFEEESPKGIQFGVTKNIEPDSLDHESSTPDEEYFPDFVPPVGVMDITKDGPIPPQNVFSKEFDEEEKYEYEDEYEEDEDEQVLLPAREAEGQAPTYMMDLYKKYSRDRYSHPVSNIVRSFENLYPDPIEGAVHVGNKTRVHTLLFNLTSVSREEDIYLGELRLYTLVEADRNQYLGVDRVVSVYEVYPKGRRLRREAEEMATTDSLNLIASRHIYGRYSGWETFDVTEAVKRWTRAISTSQILEVRIDTVKRIDKGEMDITTRPNKDKGPLIVVFSNDPRRRRTENKELHDIISQEMKLEDIIEDENEVDNYYNDHSHDHSLEKHQEYYDEEEYMENYVLSPPDEMVEKAEIRKRDTYNIISVNESTVSVDTDVMSGKSNTSAGKSQSRKQFMRDLYQEVLDIQEQDVEDDLVKLHRRKRSKQKKKKKRNICKRKPMYVNFEDINWHSWIIAPKGYEAYECRGRCYYPLSDHLTPTKHAIIQTLVHTAYRDRASKACCVPTKLDPISILYIDEEGVVTYKYKYEGMKVAECGCR